VICAGVNPVDAKGLVGDKLPGPLAALGKRCLDGRGVGFDFAGTFTLPPHQTWHPETGEFSATGCPTDRADCSALALAVLQGSWRMFRLGSRRSSGGTRSRPVPASTPTKIT
jgi:hypothetical protein